MNSLSWFLYLADVLDRIGFVFFLLSLIFSFISLFVLIAFAVWTADEDKNAERSYKSLRWVPLTTVFFFFLTAIIPSKDTIYLIAASEAGEMVVNTPEAKEVMSDLKEILNIQLDKLKE
jgi:hypothetical protein